MKRERYKLDVQIEQEADGRWLAEVTNVPGAMAYTEFRQSPAYAAYRAISLAIEALENESEGGDG